MRDLAGKCFFTLEMLTVFTFFVFGFVYFGGHLFRCDNDRLFFDNYY